MLRSIRSRAILPLFAALLLSPWQPALARSAADVFVPDQVFAGHLEGHGTLQLGPGRPRAFEVSSDGVRADGGGVRLHQVVRFAGKPATARDWTLTPIAPGIYTGTLTEATGPVRARVAARRLTLSYPLQGGLVMHQTLDLQPDGRTIDNRATIRFLRIPVGWLRETIVRTP